MTLTCDVRPGRQSDVTMIMGLLRLKAEFDRCPDAFVANPSELSEAWFSDSPVAHALVVEDGDRLVGLATYHITFSTFLGQKALWLDDLFVVEEFRSRGVGAKLLDRLVRIAIEQNLMRMDLDSCSNQ